MVIKVFSGRVASLALSLDRGCRPALYIQAPAKLTHSKSVLLRMEYLRQNSVLKPSALSLRINLNHRQG